MRRILAVLVVLGACGAALTLGTVAAVMQGREGGWRCTRSAATLVPASASAAEEAMKFVPVPAESVPDRSRSTRRGAAVVAPAPPAAPDQPDNDNAEPGQRIRIRERDYDRSGDVVRFGSDIHIRSGQTVSGDVVAMGGDVTVDGHVEGDVVAMGGNIQLNTGGEIDGQVVTIGGQLHEQPGSRVGGQRVTAGGLPRRWMGAPFMGVMGLVGSGVKVLITIIKMMVVLLIAWGFTQLAPQRTLGAFNAFKSEPLMCFGIGLLAWALVIPSIVALALVVAILCITIIGIPLALAVILAYVLAMILLVVWGYVVGAAALGERLARQLNRTATSLTMMAVWGIVGLSAVRVVGHLFGGLPMGGFFGGFLVVLSMIVGWVLLTIGAGALLRTQWRRETIAQWWPGSRAQAAASAAAGSTVPPPSAPSGPAPGPEPSAPAAPSA